MILERPYVSALQLRATIFSAQRATPAHQQEALVSRHPDRDASLAERLHSCL